MPSVRMANEKRVVNRTVTLPAYLNAAALEQNIIFSQVLQKALKTKLKLVLPTLIIAVTMAKSTVAATIYCKYHFSL